MSISKIKYNDNKQAVLIVDSLDNIDHEALKEYMNLNDSSFLKCDFEEDESVFLYYSYEKHMPLKDCLSQTVTKKNAIGFLKSLTRVYMNAQNRGMNTKHILLGINSVFVHMESNEVACIYVPVEEGVITERPLRLFIKELLVNMMYSDDDDMTWLGDLIRYINRNRQLNMDAFYNYLSSLDEEVLSNIDEALDMTPIIIEETTENLVINDAQIEEKQEEEAADVSDHVGCLYRRSNQFVYELQNEVTRVGKACDNEICVQDNPVISRVHAIITRNGGMYSLRDNASTNHTFVNGIIMKPNQDKVLSENDRIVLGNEEFVFKLK